MCSGFGAPAQILDERAYLNPWYDDSGEPVLLTSFVINTNIIVFLRFKEEANNEGI
jgi:hypothetical protein